MWSITAVTCVELKYDKTGISETKRLDEYFFGLKKCPGRHRIVNVRTRDTSCVLASLIADFHLRENTNLLKFKRESGSSYVLFKDACFQFPSLALNRPVTLEDFPSIEKQCGPNIELSHLIKEKEGIRLVNIYWGV